MQLREYEESPTTPMTPLANSHTHFLRGNLAPSIQYSLEVPLHALQIADHGQEVNVNFTVRRIREWGLRTWRCKSTGSMFGWANRSFGK